MSVWYNFKKDYKDNSYFESKGYGRGLFGTIKEYILEEKYLNNDDEYPWYKLHISCLNKIATKDSYYSTISELFKKANSDIIWIQFEW